MLKPSACPPWQTERETTRLGADVLLHHHPGHDHYLERLDCTDAEEGPASSARARTLAEKIASLKQRQTRYTALQADLERTGESQVSLTDPDSRAMATHPKVGVGYNAQVAVDATNKLIAAFEVTNAGSDLGLLAQTASVAKEALGVDTIQAVADRGYYKGEDIQACEDARIEAYVARPQRGSAVHGGLFRKDEFTYDPAGDTYTYPGGHLLHPLYSSTKDGMERHHYVNWQACRECELRPQCTSGTGRRVARWTGEAVLDRMEQRLAARPGILNLRRETVEHPFGSIKQWMNQGAFLMRGLEKVRAEFSLTALAYNMTRAINLVGVHGLMRAI